MHGTEPVAGAGGVPPRRRVLLDGTKLADLRMDGIKRYVTELFRALAPLAREQAAEWQFEVTLDAHTAYPLADLFPHEGKSIPPTALTLADPLRRHAEQVDAHRRRLAQSHGMSLGRRGLERLAYRWAKLQLSVHRRWRKYVVPRNGGPAPRVMEPHDYDLVHLTLPNTWKHYRRFHARLLTTVHDLSHLVCPELQQGSNVRSLAAGMRFAAESDSDYLAVSRATRDDMIRLLDLPAERITVTHLACDQERFTPRVSAEARRAIRRKHGLEGAPFLAAVATLEPRKNLPALVRAFRRLRERRPEMPARLAIGGGFGWGDSTELMREVEAEPSIRLLGYLSEEELPALLAEARAFCFPSRYEGFGLPLLEAMSCGVPVLYGDNSSLPEIAGDGGLPASAHSLDALTHALDRLLHDDPLHQQLAARALARAEQFSWNRTAAATWRAYEQALEKPPSAERGDGRAPRRAA